MSLEARASFIEREHAAPLTPLAVSPVSAAEIVGTTRSNIYELLRSGELRSFKLGRRRLIAVAELEQFVARMDATGGIRVVDGATKRKAGAA